MTAPVNNRLIDVSIKQASRILTSIAVDGFTRPEAIPQNVCLSGPPGVGKSAITHQMCSTLKEHLPEGAEVVVIDVRVGSMESSDVQGIPHVKYVRASLDDLNATKDETTGQMVFSTPSWWPKKKPNTYYILFLDELMNASKSVQHAAYRIILDRTIHNGEKLPVNCMIIAAGNRPEDNTGARPLLPAAANRFACHLSITKHDESVDYMIQQEWEPMIISFLKNDGSDMINNVQLAAESPAFPTQRSWEEMNKLMQNKLLFNMEEFRSDTPKSHRAIGDMRVVMASCIGDTAANKFASHCAYLADLPVWDRVFNEGTAYKYEIPTNMSKRYALADTAGLMMIKALVDNYTDRQLKNFVELLLSQFNDSMLTRMFQMIRVQPKTAPMLLRSAGSLGPEFMKIAKAMNDIS